MKSYFFLFIAIVSELIGTSFLKQSEGFTKLVPTLITIIAMVSAFYCLSLSLRSIPLGIAYAIWSGVGIVFITLIGFVFFKQTPDLPALIGIGLIVGGVAMIHLFSKMSVH